MFQIDERIQKTLMTMGTQIFGVTTDTEASYNLARQFFRYNPYLIKKFERVWMADMMGPYVVDHKTVEFTPEEQILLGSYKFMDQGRFQFLVRPAPREGDVTGRLQRLSIDDVDRGLYPNDMWVQEGRSLLVDRGGRAVNDLLSEIEARREKPRGLLPPKRKVPPAYAG
jgi:hypothetical protein